MRITWGVLLLLFALPARGDTFYSVNGSTTLTGNDVCGGPCVETLDFSFQLDEAYSQLAAGYQLSIVPSTVSLSATGPLSAPVVISTQPGCDFYCFFEVLFGTTVGPFGKTELDIYTNETNGPSTTPFVPIFGFLTYDYLYACGDSACVTDFCVDPPFGCSPPAVDAGTVTASVSEVTSGSPPRVRAEHA